VTEGVFDGLMQLVVCYPVCPKYYVRSVGNSECQHLLYTKKYSVTY